MPKYIVGVIGPLRGEYGSFGVLKRGVGAKENKASNDDSADKNAAQKRNSTPHDFENLAYSPIEVAPFLRDTTGWVMP